MSLPTVSDAAYPTPTEIRNTILSAVRYAYAKAGLVANVKPGSDHYIRAKSYADRVSIAIANNKLALVDFSPLEATGDALESICDIFGVYRRAAVGASGYVDFSFTSSVSITIPAAFQCTAPNGKKYQTLTAQTFSGGTGTIAVTCTETGTTSDQDADTVVTWDSASIGALAQTATVASGAIDGGEDADDDEKLRDRLLRKLAFPGVGGNWSQIAQWAEESSASVEAAYVYPAVRGPGSVDVVVTLEGGDRAVSSQVVSVVDAYILGNLPGHADINVTTVDPDDVDVVIDLELPLPVAAGGAGGGWVDSIPWPDNSDATAPSNSAIATLTINEVDFTISRGGGSWITDRFRNGMTIAVTGTVSNNATYTIDTVTALVITLSGSPVLAAETVAPYAAGLLTSSAAIPASVLAVTSTTITVSAATSPTVGDHFAVWDPDALEMSHFTVGSVSGSAGGFVITVGAAEVVPSSIVGAYVSADAEFIDDYAADMLAAVQALGPGEKTASDDILPRGRRHPSQDVEHPSALTAVHIGALTRSYPEILDASYGARFAGDSITTLTEPSVPTTTADPARILVLQHLAFRSSN